MSWSKQFLEGATAGDIPHYSALEIAGGFASIFSLLIAVLCIFGCLLGISAVAVFPFFPDKRLLPVIFGPILLSLGFYALALSGGLVALGFWSGVALVGLSYPLLKRRALRRSASKIAGPA